MGDGFITVEAVKMAALAIETKQIVTLAKDALRSKDDEVVDKMMMTLFKVEVPRDE